MTKVYTKIKGKLAMFVVETEDYELAIKTVRDEVGLRHRPLILALIERKEELKQA